MALQFDLVSPERRLASLSASAVQIPGADGDMTAMEGHAPTITTLRPGVLTVTTASGTEAYVVSGGFAEIAAASVTVLAEQALPKAEVTQAAFDRMLADAKAAADIAKSDDAAKTVADMLAMGDAVGLTVR
jgi:F-type H+-transporting ATPase subunit epsilon